MQAHARSLKSRKCSIVNARRAGVETIAEVNCLKYLKTGENLSGTTRHSLKEEGSTRAGAGNE